MGESTIYDLVVRGRLVDIDKGKFSNIMFKSKSRSKSHVQLTRRCWKCSKVLHYKRDCKSKAMYVSTQFEQKNSTKKMMTTNKGCDVYLALTSTQSNQYVWFIESRESYHMTPHREWFCEYE
jgi:hypothetical protein